ncbi:MAG TPA: RNA polymerase sigma factor [Kiritimatiellia bacterium]|nr:RNA polymerase sigma factor [Kiritimatiellia bacterium]HRZ12005.1 RNA polymerase sigma factor [Kiritimatiellia bacterium]HSA17189.1 RNA polymerase sigma factor [Kiritimatiellia bacterium]
MHEDSEDFELMRRLRDGDPEAMTGLVRRYQGSLLNFFRRMGACTDAEDAVQETFIRVYNYRDRYRPSAKFTTFLYTVARHVWHDLLRKVMRRESLAERITAEPEPEQAPGPSGAALRLDIHAALARLPEKLRGVVVLGVYQGMRQEEIAAVLDIPVGTVKSRMFNALERLKEAFDEER